MTARLVAAGAVVVWALWPATVPREQGQPVEFQMRNVALRLAPGLDLEVRALRGRLKRTQPDRAVTFDDSNSFRVEVDRAEVAMTPGSLATLLNSYVLAYPGSPVKDVQVAIQGQRLIQKGKLHKGVDLSFEIDGSVSATPDGNIRVHADKIKSEGLPVKGLLHLFGADLSKLMQQNASRGLQVEGDDIVLSPSRATPAPHMDGRVVRVELKGGKLVQTFDSGRRSAELRPPLRNEAYIYHRGGVLHFGKMTMEDADLEIVADRRAGPFVFFLHEYQRQLVAGYSKSTPAKGLVVHMVDYRRLGRAAAAPAAGQPTGQP